MVDGNLYELSEEIKLEKNKKHNIEIVVDRLMIREGIEKRLTDSLETALKQAEGLVIVDVIGQEPMTFSQSFSCPDCGIIWMRSSREYFLLIILLVPVRCAPVRVSYGI